MHKTDHPALLTGKHLANGAFALKYRNNLWNHLRHLHDHVQVYKVQVISKRLFFFSNYARRHLAELQLPVAIGMHLLARILSGSHFNEYRASGLPVDLDECLLSLSLQLWNQWKQGSAFYDFPVALKPLIGGSYRPYQCESFSRTVGSFPSPYPHINRYSQFLHEAERVSGFEMVVFKSIGHRLPPGLVQNIIDMSFEPYGLPRSSEFNKTWTPQPNRQKPNVPLESNISGTYPPDRCDCEVHWLPASRTHVPVVPPPESQTLS